MPEKEPKVGDLALKKGKSKRATNADVEEALRAAKGIMSAASQWLAKHKGMKLSRQAIAWRVEQSPALQETLAEIRESTLDFAENKLLELMNKGDKTALIFYLKCHGKARGFTERHEITGKDGAPLSPQNVKFTYRLVRPEPRDNDG